MEESSVVVVHSGSKESLDQKQIASSFTDPYDSFIKKHLQHYGYSCESTDEWISRNASSWCRFQYDVSSLWGSVPSSHGINIANENAESQEGSETIDKDARNQRTHQLKYVIANGSYLPLLQEPRNLYALTAGPQTAVRWPSELKVAIENLHLTHYVPRKPEQFYKATLKELQPPRKVIGTVVYNNPASTRQFFRKSCVNYGRSKNGRTSTTSTNSYKLSFESRFESGNLAKAVLVDNNTYELYLRPDLYTNSYTHWFYFRVQNMKTDRRYRFSIVNLYTAQSLYRHGLKPLMYSENMASSLGIGWHRVGTDISYYKNYAQYDDDPFENLYTLTWTMDFPYENDTVYFAYCYPYTYTDLQEHINNLQKDALRAQYCQFRVLCRTVAGNNVYMITVSSQDLTEKEKEREKRKKVIILTARVHPGETPSSWVMKGFLDFLTSNSTIAQLLREKFIFKLVPMLNPDGVIVGNHRCSLLGKDLNRSYRTMLKDTCPSVWHIRHYVRKLLQERDVVLYCDLHSHNRRNNIFLLGCKNSDSSTNCFTEQIFALLFQKQAPDMFSFDSCQFKVQKQRQNTGRVVMWLLGISLSYTLEVSVGGSSLGSKKGTHFNTHDYEMMALHFCSTIHDYFDESHHKGIYLHELQVLYRNKMLQTFSETGLDESDSGSSSDSLDIPIYSQMQKENEELFERSPESPKSPTAENSPRPIEYITCQVCKSKILNTHFMKTGIQKTPNGPVICSACKKISPKDKYNKSEFFLWRKRMPVPLPNYLIRKLHLTKQQNQNQSLSSESTLSSFPLVSEQRKKGRSSKTEIVRSRQKLNTGLTVVPPCHPSTIERKQIRSRNQSKFAIKTTER